MGHDIKATELLTMAILAARVVAHAPSERALKDEASTEKEYLDYCRENGITPLPIEVHS